MNNNLGTFIFNFTKQLESGFQIPKINIKNKFDNVIFSGMGGSALVGDILSNFSDIRIPIYTIKDYNLPRWANQNTLIFCISYSGNTEETLNVFKQALKKNLTIISMASGGKLKKLSLKYKTFFVEIPFKDIKPRFSIWFQLAALIKIFLQDLNLIKFPTKKIILGSAKNLKINQLNNLAKDLAKKLENKIIMLYGATKNESILKIWKANFNENAKIPIFYNVVPELNHNEIAFLENKKINTNHFYVVLLKLGNESPEIIKRINLTKKLFKKHGLFAEIIEIKNKNIIGALFSSIILAQLSSIYLAQKYQLDPFEAKIIEKFKQLIKRN